MCVCGCVFVGVFGCVGVCVCMSNCVGPRIIDYEVAESNIGLFGNAKQNIFVLPNAILRNTFYTIRLFVC